jgi:cobalt-zinc-cadmium efflux system outer membrane protein
MIFRFKLIVSIALLLVFGFVVKAQDKYTLRRALQTAKANNPFLKTEQFAIGIAQAEAITSKQMYNPILGLNYINIASQKNAAPNSDLYSAINNQYAFQLGKTFQVVGQRKHKIDMAGKNIVLAEKSYTETERNLFFEVAQKWLEVWVAQKQLDILTSAKDNIDSLVITNQNRYKNQVITQTDLYRTQLLSKQYAIQYKTMLQEHINKQAELRFLLGSKDSAIIDMEDPFLFIGSENIDGLLAQSLENRSDITTAKTWIEVSDSNIKLQKSLALPQPEVGVIYNPQNTIPYWGIYATFDLPIFNRNQGEIKKSVVLKKQAEQHLFTIQEQLQTEIKTAYASYKLQQQNVQNFETVIQQSQSILNNVKYAYLKSGTTIIDFLEAQRSWLETQQQYYETLQHYRQSYFQLLYATGLINQLAK